ncbi:MAG: hypothetical protein AAGA96_12550 [Verrucomicrobiota bacterium]
MKKEIEDLAPAERRELMGFMVGLQIREDNEYREMITNRIDDKTSENWVSLEELDEKLNSSG